MSAHRPSSPWVAFSAVSIGTFMGTIDASIVNVALPTMRAELGATIGGVEWVVTAYLLVVSAALLSSGRLGDLAGHRRVFVGGLLLFTLGSGACGLAQGLGTLVIARVVQALGASAMTAIGPAVVTAIFPPAQRGRALGAITSVVAVGLTAGPPMGGFLVQHLSWRWIFFVNLPVGIVGAIWASRSLPETARPAGAQPARFDPGGGLLLAATVAAGLGAVTLAPSSPAPAAGLAIGAVGAALWLARRSRQVPSPVFDFGLFERRAFATGILACFLSYMALFTAALMNPFYLAQIKGMGPRDLGSVMVIVPLAMSLTSPLAGWLSDRFPSRALGALGMAFVAGGLLGLGLLAPDRPIALFGAYLVALGLGMGLFQPPNNSAVMGSLPRERLGSGGGMLATSRTSGMAIGIALAGALFHLRAGPAPDANAFLSGYRAAVFAGALLAAAAGLVSVLVGGPAAAPPGRA